MKNKNIAVSSLFIAVLFFFSISSCTKSTDSPGNTSSSQSISNLQTQLNSLPKESLSISETNSLIMMREEEKLARDVYTTMYKKWGINIFNNISLSEQSHMDAVLLLLNKYDLTDPIQNNTIGEFTSTNLKDLYNQLIIKGNISITEAYKVGATIEDLDIFDLNNALIINNNQDIRLVYESLAKGSRNHMRSFYSNLTNIGIIYSAQFISQTELDAIIASAMERGF